MYSNVFKRIQKNSKEFKSVQKNVVNVQKMKT